MTVDGWYWIVVTLYGNVIVGGTLYNGNVALVCACACVRACVRARARVRACVRACVEQTSITRSLQHAQ